MNLAQQAMDCSRAMAEQEQCQRTADHPTHVTHLTHLTHPTYPTHLT